MGNMDRDPEPEQGGYDRFSYHMTKRSNHSTDRYGRKQCVVLLADAKWLADEYRDLLRRVAELEAKQ